MAKGKRGSRQPVETPTSSKIANASGAVDSGPNFSESPAERNPLLAKLTMLGGAALLWVALLIGRSVAGYLLEGGANMVLTVLFSIVISACLATALGGSKVTKAFAWVVITVIVASFIWQ